VGAFGAEIFAANLSGTNRPADSNFLSGAYAGVIGAHIDSTGNKVATAGLWIGPAAAPAQFDIGVFISPGAIQTYAMTTTGFLIDALGHVGFTGTAAGSTPLCYDTTSFGGLAALTGCVSDRRLKQNIVPLPDGALDKIMSLKPVNYTLIADKTNRLQAHIIAQDVQPIIPEAIIEQNDVRKTLTTDDKVFTAYLIKAVQELNTQVQALKAGK
jgi:hypothetical protein